jgi:L-ascorbate metabolism protein UlaG (beta-lactamase superfamily)
VIFLILTDHLAGIVFSFVGALGLWLGVMHNTAMLITKYGHCCLLLETAEKRILVDPGRFSETQNTLTDIDIILITHEHADHYHSESVTAILRNNPEAIVVTNSSVAKLLEALDVETHVLEGRESADILDVPLKAYDGTHIEIFENFGIVQNTGYLIDNTFFFPGDAYTVPDVPVKVLGLPVAGPWCKASDAIYYCIKVAPSIAIPVHDATLSEAGREVTYGLFERELKKHDVSFMPLVLNTPVTIPK